MIRMGTAINPLIDAATRRSAATQIQAHRRGAGNAGGLHAQLYERQLPGRASRISQPAPAAAPHSPVSETGYTAATSRRCPTLRPRPARRNTRGLWHSLSSAAPLRRRFLCKSLVRYDRRNFRKAARMDEAASAVRPIHQTIPVFDCGTYPHFDSLHDIHLAHGLAITDDERAAYDAFRFGRYP